MLGSSRNICCVYILLVRVHVSALLQRRDLRSLHHARRRFGLSVIGDGVLSEVPLFHRVLLRLHHFRLRRLLAHSPSAHLPVRHAALALDFYVLDFSFLHLFFLCYRVELF